MAKVSLREVLQNAMEHFQAGRFPQAESLYRQILAVQPAEPNSLHFLGLIALQTGRVEEAVELLKRVVEKHPQYTEARSNLGAALHAAKRLDEAAACFQTLLEMAPNFAQGYFNLARVYKDQERLEDAMAYYQRAIALHAGFAEAYNNIAAIYRDLDRLKEAEHSMKAAVALKPNAADFHYFLGVIQKDQHLFAEAMMSFQRALALDANYAEAHRDLGYLLLMRGDFARGWAEHEWRWKCKDVQNPYPHPAQPAWDGTALKGRSLFLVTEQGMGDSIQYIRYAALIAQGGGKIHLVCPEPLRRLFSTAPGVAGCYGSGDALPLADVYATTLSLPHLFQTTLDNLPHQVPYLAPVARDVAHWREKLNAYAGKFKVGLVWSGNPKHTNDRNRSISLRQLAPLADTNNITFFSLQKTVSSEASEATAPAFELVDYTAELHDFADTAALIANLDLVISVDTSVAHLAGALGKPTWILLPFVADWRWFLERSDSPWYPTARLFRQPRQGDWGSAIAAVAEALKEAALRIP